MSIVIPPELNWLVEMAAGQAWPKGNEDKLSLLGDAWNRAAEQLMALVDDIGSVSSKVLEGVSGPAAEQFSAFVDGLRTSIPQLADGAGGLGALGKQVALQLEYSKYMILLQLIWMAEQIAEWASTIFGAALVPEIEAVGQIAVQSVLRTLFKQVAKSVAESVAAQVGMDAAVQVIQFMKGDRTKWDVSSTVGAAEMGALAGALGGVLHIGAGYLAPDLTKSLVGHVGMGVLNGVVVGEVSNLAFGSNQDLGQAAAGGVLGGALGYRGQHGENQVKVPEVNVKGIEDLGGIKGKLAADVPSFTGMGDGGSKGVIGAPSSHPAVDHGPAGDQGTTLSGTHGGTQNGAAGRPSDLTSLDSTSPQPQEHTGFVQLESQPGTSTVSAHVPATETAATSVTSAISASPNAPRSSEHFTGLPGFEVGTVTTIGHDQAPAVESRAVDAQAPATASDRGTGHFSDSAVSALPQSSTRTATSTGAETPAPAVRTEAAVPTETAVRTEPTALTETAVHTEPTALTETAVRTEAMPKAATETLSAHEPLSTTPGGLVRESTAPTTGTLAAASDGLGHSDRAAADVTEAPRLTTNEPRGLSLSGEQSHPSGQGSAERQLRADPTRSVSLESTAHEGTAQNSSTRESAAPDVAREAAAREAATHEAAPHEATAHEATAHEPATQNAPTSATRPGESTGTHGPGVERPSRESGPTSSAAVHHDPSTQHAPAHTPDQTPAHPPTHSPAPAHQAPHEVPSHTPSTAHTEPHVWHTGPDAHAQPPEHIERFASHQDTTSFLDTFGASFGRTLNLRDTADPATAAHGHSASTLLPDANGRYTIAAHGDAQHIVVGGYRLTPEAFAQLLRAHPDWPQMQVDGLRLIACDTGAAIGHEPAFAQRLADELGVNVSAPTKTVWTSSDGLALVADVNPARMGLPLTSSTGHFQDFAPTRSDAPRELLPDTPIHPPGEHFDNTGAADPRWSHDVLSWAVPYQPAAIRADGTHDPLVPWYGRAADNMHALGDMSVVKVTRPVDARNDATTAMTQLKAAPLHDAQGNALVPPRTVEHQISDKLQREFEHEVAKALQTTDPGEWNKYLRSGLTIGHGDTILRVRFRLEGDTQAPAITHDPDPVLTEYLSKYGDISFLNTVAHQTSKSFGVVGEVLKSATDAVTSFVPISFKLGLSASAKDSHTLADEVQLGNRATTNARVGVDHTVRIDVSLHSKQGFTAATTHTVADKTVTAAHPTAYGPADLTAHQPIAVQDHAAVERFDYTLGAVDPKPLEDSFLQAVLGEGKISAANAASVMEVASSEFLDEKSLRDRAQNLFTDSLTTNFMKTNGFAGYANLRGRIVSVQEIGRSTEGGIRNDMAETMTVGSVTAHGQETSLKIGGDISFHEGTTVRADVRVSAGNQHTASSQIQGQAKTAVIHDGPQRRYQATIQVDGEIQADRRFLPNVFKPTEPVRGFGAQIHAEILVPEHQAAAFEAAIQHAPAPAPAPARAGFTEANQGQQRRIVQRFGPTVPVVGTRANSALMNHPATHTMVRKTVMQGAALRAKAERWAGMTTRQTFPPAGFADGPIHTTLSAHLRAANGPTAVHVEPGHTFTQAELVGLHDLQQNHGLRLFEVPHDPAAAARELIVDRHDPAVGPAHYDTTPNPVPSREDVTAAGFKRGYVLDATGVTHGWDGRPQVVTPNPARHAPPAAAPAPAREQIGRVRDLATRAGTRTAPRDIALVVDTRRSPHVDTAVTRVVDNPRLHTDLIQGSPRELLNRPNLPREGYVANPAGRVAWGWRPAGLAGWGHTDNTARPALADIVHEASRGGVQLVVHPNSRFANDVRQAVTRVNATSAADGQGARNRLQEQQRFAVAAAQGPAHLGTLTHDELLRMLVTDRSIRIVDERGVARAEFNAREQYAMREAAPGTPNAGNYEPQRVHTQPVDTSLKLDRELAVHADGNINRSVAWKSDGTVTDHTRRALREADTRDETPDLVAGAGFGSAAGKELPGAQEIHHTVRAIIKGMIDHDRSAGPVGNQARAGDSRAQAKLDRAAARNRFRFDKQMQLALSVPKVRGARGRPMDAGMRERFDFNGRSYDVSVRQVLTETRSGATAPREERVGIDHQTKGTRGGGSAVTRSWKAGAGFGASQRVELPHDWSIDVGEIGVEATHSRAYTEAQGAAGKSYSRLRAPNGDAARPEYGARYQVTVTQTSHGIFSGTKTRTVSRILDGPGVSLPAIVHESLRPARDVADTAQYRDAFFDVAGTVGRTTRLETQDFTELRQHPDFLDFSKTGTSGLHATFSGLDDAVRTTADFVARRAGGADPGERAPWQRPEYVAQIERSLSEGFLRSNLPRLLSAEGMPIALPKEHPLDPTKPNVSSAVTVRAFLVRADPAAGHDAARATVESYREVDTKMTKTVNKATELGVGGEVGAVVKLKSPQPPEATGDPTGPPGTPAGGPTSKRAIGNRVGFSVKGDAGVILSSKTTSRTAGSIDVSLLTESGGQRFERAHLVLEVTSTRQPVDVGLISGTVGKLVHSRDTFQTSTETLKLLVENSVELSLSPTLNADVAAPAPKPHLDPLPIADRTLHITRDDAAFATGYSTHYDDTGLQFRHTTDANPAGTPLPAHDGILGAIKHGLETAGVDPGRLNDASDAWRALTAKFSPEEVTARPDDLRGVGVLHRAEFPAFGGRTQRLTVRVTAEPTPFEQVRGRDQGAVTVGGQSLKQEGENRTTGFHAAGGAGFAAQFTKDGVSYGAAGLDAEHEYERLQTTGEEAVIRDIRRATAVGQSDPLPAGQQGPRAQRTATDGEEFQQRMTVKITIHGDTEWPEPAPRISPLFDRASVHAPEPLVTLSSAGHPGGGPQAPVPATHLVLRTVVPRHITDEGALPPAPPAAPAPTVRVATADAARPGLLEHELGQHMQGLTFPGLEHVAEWAPTATLSTDRARGFAERTVAGAADPAPARFGAFAPTSDRGLKLNTTLTNRNVRDNVKDLFTAKLELPSTSSDPMKLGAHVDGVIRPTGKPAQYAGLTFKERADEPNFAAETSHSYNGGMSLGGGDHGGGGVPEGGMGLKLSSEPEGTAGDYVEYNRSFKQDTYTYGGRFSYSVSDEHGSTLMIDSGRKFEGLLPEGWAKQAAEHFPTQVVHPHAQTLPADQTARDAAAATIADRYVPHQDDTRPPALPAPTAAEPLRLVADVEHTTAATDVNALVTSARDLALRVNGPVDLALVRHDAAGVATHIDHHVVDPAEILHQQALNRQADARQLAGDHPQRWDALTTATDAVVQARIDAQPFFDRRDELGRQLAGNTLAELRQASEQARGIADQRQAEISALLAANPNAAPTVEQVRARHDAEETATQAAKAVDDRIALEAQKAAADRAAERQQERIDEAVTERQTRADAVQAVADAATAAQTARDGSLAAADRLGHDHVEAALNSNSLGALPVPQAVAAAWRPTESGYALPADNHALAAAQGLPQHRDTTTLSVGAPDPAGGYTLRDRNMTVDNLAHEVYGQLTANGAQPPRRLVIHGDNSAGLARAVSERFAAENARRAALHPPQVAEPLLPPILVIGAGGTIVQADGVGSWSGTFDRQLSRFTHTPLRGWTVYQDGQPMTGFPPRGDLSALLSSLDAMPHRNFLTQIGVAT